MKKLFVLILLLLSFTGFFQVVHGQEQINIIHAERAEGDIIDGEPVRKLIGEVQLQTEQTVMDADSAYQFEEQNMIHAFNIQIESENDIIWADTLYHNTLSGYSEFRGRVIIFSDRNTLFSESMDYDRILDVALFHSPVRFEDDRGALIADDGYYFQNTDIAFFRGNVQLADSTQYLEADSLFMNRETDYYRLFNNVYAEDFEERVTFTGDYLESDSSGHRLLSGSAWMMQVNEAETDTTHLNSEIIQVTETDTSDFIDSYNNVKIWSASYAAIADTAYYRNDIEQFRLVSNPVAWQKRIQLTGPYIEAFLENDEMKLLTSFTRPIAVQQDSLTERLNQMKGDTLHAFFDEGEIDSIVVYDNSELIYHLKDDNNEPDGLIELMADGPSTITFLNGDLDDFKAVRNIDGSHLPESPENTGRELAGFRWDPELKPERPEIHQPRLPAIPDEKPFELPERYLRYLEQNESVP